MSNEEDADLVTPMFPWYVHRLRLSVSTSSQKYAASPRFSCLGALLFYLCCCRCHYMKSTAIVTVTARDSIDMPDRFLALAA